MREGEGTMSTTIGVRGGAGAGLNVGRLALVGAAGVAGVLGFMGGGDGGAGSDLVLLMRFMAGVKAAMALGAVALVAWRMGAPTGRGTVAAYVVATAVMAVGPGLIWNMQDVAYGAMAVHGGLSAIMLVAWRDRQGWNGVLGAAVARRRMRLAR
jgi:hypothetical protein